jgi:site-specific DNA recombinase
MRAAIYTRISSDDGTALGVRRQEEDCRELAARQRWTVVGVYTDNDLSASNGKPRPAYRRLLDDLAAGVATAVIVWDLDRLHRRPKELEEFLELADQHHIALASVGGDVDLASPQGRLVARIKGAVARQEADQISRRVRRKFDQLAATGQVTNGGKRPYGYSRDRMTVVAEEATVVQELAARVLAGESLHELVRDLNRRGVPTVTGVAWSRVSVRTLLCGPRIAGLRQHRGVIVGSAAWPAILDQGTWETVRARLTDPSRRPPGQSNARRHLLSGMVRCAVCLGPLHIHYAGYRLAPGYACRRRGCGKVRVSIAALDEFITKLALARLAKEGIRPAGDPPDRDLDRQIAAVEARLRQVAVEFADDPDVTPEQVREMTRRLRAKLDDLHSRQADRLESDVLNGLDGPDVADLWPVLPLSRRRAIIGIVVPSITVAPASRPGSPVFEPERVDVPPWEGTTTSS